MQIFSQNGLKFCLPFFFWGIIPRLNNIGSIHLTDLKGGELILRNRGEGGDATSDDFSIEHPGGLEYPHWGLIENFVDHLIDGVPLLCDGTEGRKSTVVLDALALAEPGGDWIEIEY